MKLNENDDYDDGDDDDHLINEIYHKQNHWKIYYSRLVVLLCHDQQAIVVNYDVVAVDFAVAAVAVVAEMVVMMMPVDDDGLQTVYDDVNQLFEFVDVVALFVQLNYVILDLLKTPIATTKIAKNV